MKELIKNALILCAITMVAGLLLGTVYEVTKEPRKEQEEKAKQKSYAAVFETADSFKIVDFDEKEVEKYIDKAGISSNKAFVNEIVSANDKDGNSLGYVITVTDKEGYGGEIKFAVGISNNAIVNGISILTINETAGLGMKAKENSFRKQFIGIKSEYVRYSKSGVSAPDEFDAISSATITSRAVCEGVNGALITFRAVGGNKNE